MSDRPTDHRNLDLTRLNLDGIPAVYFDGTFSEDTLREFTKSCIDIFAPNLVLGISDETSSHGDIERIRLVGEIVDDYNAALA